MFKSKLECVILAAALFISVSPVYKLLSGRYADSKDSLSANISEAVSKTEPLYLNGKYYDQRMASAL